MRKQRREEREKEKQELVRQGLLEAPPPKVKLSNMMRVLGTEAVADPTALEAQVRSAMLERQQVSGACLSLVALLDTGELRLGFVLGMFDDSWSYAKGFWAARPVSSVPCFVMCCSMSGFCRSREWCPGLLPRLADCG